MARMLTPANMTALALLALVAALAIRQAGAEEKSGLASTQCVPADFLEETGE